MRTTLTLDPDVAARLKQTMRRTGMTLKAAVNDLLRRGFAADDEMPKPAPFQVEAHACGGFVAGVDAAKLGQLLDELEADHARASR